ncbi:MAG: 30S ribosomal protein S7 [Patescibacteria group bacterium]|nr:30S ribosomal protein S7 [Patescibacteria group bacterium]MDD5164780.1 30S ribosomal protein S7 [Patescibacteria group bacterium]MDD5534798.1 30S ribosomal protein S7 [Patescibacteria group bacterium]
MRGKQSIKRKILPDIKYNSLKLAKFINYIMERGKKTTAQKIVYGAIDILAKQNNKDGLEVFNQAMENISPMVELRSRRVGGANYQVPVQTTEDRRFVLASRWIIEAARNRKGKAMAEKLAQEMTDALNNQGLAIKKKDDVYRMAEANKAFAHFAQY